MDVVQILAEEFTVEGLAPVIDERARRDGMWVFNISQGDVEMTIRITMSHDEAVIRASAQSAAQALKLLVAP